MKIEINKNYYDGMDCVFDASQSVNACGYMNGRSCSAAKSEGQSLDVGQTGRKCIGKRKFSDVEPVSGCREPLQKEKCFEFEGGRDAKKRKLSHSGEEQPVGVDQTRREYARKRQFSEVGEESVSLPANKKKRMAEKEEKKVVAPIDNESSSESLCAKTIRKIQETSPLAGNIANSAAIIMEALWHGRIKPNASDIGKYVENFGPLSSKLGQLFAANVNIPWEKRKDFLHLCKNNQPESFDYIDQQIKQAGKELGFEVVSIEKNLLGLVLLLRFIRQK
ncbi:hypothetical protein [Endozoicomonas sp. Mp262]|uniref:hypothetical protein n=1 Tax=Endozoicomonas sp. Mp262 TaxID=2919499 RepID=UPI0021D8A059